MIPPKRPLQAARFAACLALLSALAPAQLIVHQASLWKTGPELVPADVGADPVERRVRAVELGDLAWTKGTREPRVFDLELFDNERVTLLLEYRGSSRPGASVWFGEFEGSNDHLALAVQDTSAAGTLRLGTELYKLRPVADGKHILAEIDESQYSVCGTEERAGTGPGGSVGPVGTGGTSGTAVVPQTQGPETQAATALVTIDVLVAYTPQMASSSGGTSGALALIDLAVLETNTSFQNSSAAVAMRLVYAYEVNYNSSGSMSTDLSNFRNTNEGYMDEVHALRTTYGADACQLIIKDGNYCGLGSLMLFPLDSFKTAAFSVTRMGCATGYYSFGHEFGHSFGCAHDTDQTSLSSTPFGFGYRTPDDQYRTVMAYAPGTKVATFSSPLSVWNGWTMGTAAKEDNGRTLTLHGPLAAGWYPTNTPILDCNQNGLDDNIELTFGLAVDLDGDGVLDECQSLVADVTEIGIASGGTQTLSLQAGIQNAGRVYLLLGSFSGTTPGLLLGSVTLPLNPDSYTNLLLATGGFPLSGLIGVLDAAGNATESFSLPAGAAPPAMLSIEAHHAYVVFDASSTADFASTAVSLTFSAL